MLWRADCLHFLSLFLVGSTSLPLSATMRLNLTKCRLVQALLCVGCLHMTSQLAWKRRVAPDDDVLLHSEEAKVDSYPEPVKQIVNVTRECHEQGPQDVDPDSLTKIWIPGYPGSGSTMLNYLRKALTGLEGENHDVYYNRCNDQVIGCKTHYPFLSREHFPPERQPYISNKYILLFRNPLNAIPSYYNFLNEKSSHATSHTVQAPKDKWIEWRDEHFDENLEAWKSFFYYWHDNYEWAMYLPYEDLISRDKGEATFDELARVFRVTNPNVTLAGDPSCLWRRDVLEKASAKRTRSYAPTYTIGQYQAMIQVLQDVKRDFPEVSAILQTYITSCLDGLRQLDSKP